MYGSLRIIVRPLFRILLVLFNYVYFSVIIGKTKFPKSFITASPKPRTVSAGDVGEARFQDSADMEGEALESLNIRKPRTLKSAEAYKS